MKKYYFIGLLVIIILLTLLVTGCFTPKKQVEFVLRQNFLGTAYVPVCPYCKSQVGDKATTCRSCSKDFKWVSKEVPCIELKCEGKGSYQCFECNGSGKCRNCEGTGKCDNCKGTIVCDFCNGTGTHPSISTLNCTSCLGTGKCKYCKNTGKCENSPKVETNRYYQTCNDGICAVCNGAGKIICKTCNGVGKIIVGK